MLNVKKITMVVFGIIFCLAYSQMSTATTVNRAYATVNVFGNFGFSWGKPMNEEEDINSVQVTYSNGSTEVEKPYFFNYNWGLYSDLFFFNSFSNADGEKNKIAGLRPAIRVRYSFNQTDMEVTVAGGSSNEEVFSETYLRHQKIMAGPVLHLVKSNDSYYFDVSWFFLGGKIHSGSMTYAAIYQKEVLGTSDSVGYNGYSFETGSGFEFGWKPVHIGVNIFYSYNWLKLNEQVYSKLSKNVGYSEVNFEFQAGINI